MNRTACASIFLAAVSGLAAVPGAAADAGGITCHGKPATLVGSPQRTYLTGTPDDDVIVSNGSLQVKGLDGNDAICLTGAYDARAEINLIAGPGDDYVRNDLSNRAVRADLGEGDDRYLGGTGKDTLFDTQPGMGQDSIDTGSGNDLVISGDSGEPNLDNIDLGPGTDTLFLHSSDSTQMSLDGGDGQDKLWTGPIGGNDVVYDNRAGVATGDGVPYVAWSRFETFPISGGTTQTFLGTGRDEHAIFGASTTFAANMRGGNDTIEVRRGSQQSDLLRGGTGTDTLRAYDDYEATVTADLGTQTVSFSTAPGAPQETTYHLGGINSLDVSADTVRLYGDDEANRINALGCSAAFVYGRGGDDVITDTGRFGEGPCAGQYGDPIFRGGKGDDRLIGATVKNQDIIRNETLLGGPGNDFANGNGGHRDVCHAETERACELN